jgi:DNA mismatch endonuclease, patch repair protein
MQAIGRKDTKPELALRSALHRAGCRFRKDFPIMVDGIRIRPDVVFTRAKMAVFVDGCFWHGCPEHGHRPKVNGWYWEPKLARTRDRDRRNIELLERHGWATYRMWEHEAVEAACDLIVSTLRTRR